MPLSDSNIIVKQAEAEKACITGFDANCPENVSRGILWPKRVGIITSTVRVQSTKIISHLYNVNLDFKALNDM